MQGRFQAVPEDIITKDNPERGVTYNWPYDFFSIIELVKVGVDVEFSDKDIEGKPSLIVQSGVSNVGLRQDLLGIGRVDVSDGAMGSTNNFATPTPPNLPGGNWGTDD